jgi:hypothetical protein
MIFFWKKRELWALAQDNSKAFWKGPTQVSQVAAWEQDAAAEWEEAWEVASRRLCSQRQPRAGLNPQRSTASIAARPRPRRNDPHASRAVPLLGTLRSPWEEPKEAAWEEGPLVAWEEEAALTVSPGGPTVLVSSVGTALLHVD